MDPREEEIKDRLYKEYMHSLEVASRDESFEHVHIKDNDTKQSTTALKTGPTASGNADYLESFVDWLKEAEKSQNTIDSYLIDLRQFLDFLKDERGIDSLDLDKQDLKTYRDHLNGRQLSVKTINRKLVAIKQFIDFMNECFDSKIILKIRPEKEQQQGFIEEMMTLNDYHDLFKTAGVAKDYRAKALFATLYYTGMRVSEMLQLKGEDTNKDEVRIKGKGNKYRTILINDKLKPIWKEYMRSRETNQGPSLFVGQRGPINRQTVHNIIKDYAEKAGVELERAHAHSFRHLFCVRLIEEGLPIDQVAKLAGHSDINTTRIYTEMTKRDYVKAINKL